MRTRDVMTPHPIIIPGNGTGDGRGDAARERAAQLMRDGAVHHVPVVEDGDVVGLWVDRPEGLRLVGPERIVEVPADANALDAMRALMEGAEVVVVREEGAPRGIVTRADALAVIATALGRGIGARSHRAAVVRVCGARGVGKSTLIGRALARLGDVDAVVLQANGEASGASRVVRDDSVAHRAGLVRAIERWKAAQLVVVEDRDAVIDLHRGLGEDAQVAVLDPDEARTIDPARLADAQLVLVNGPGRPVEEVRAAAAELHVRVPRLRTIAVTGDAGNEEFAAWLRGLSARRRA